MSSVIITMKLMPKSPDTDLAKIQEAAKEKITAFGGKKTIRKRSIFKIITIKIKTKKQFSRQRRT